MQKTEITEMSISPILKSLFNIERFINISYESKQSFRFGHNQIFVLQKGKGTLLIDGKIVQLSNNTIILLSKGQIYSFVESLITGYLLQFDDSFWRKTPISANNCKAVLFDTNIHNRQFFLNATDIKSIVSIFEAALKEFETLEYSNKPDVLAAYLKIVVIKIANIHFMLQKDIGNYDNKLYQNFIALVNQEGNIIHDVATFSLKLGVSSRKLSDACNNFGVGAKEIINRHLIAEAKRDLQFTSKPIKEISGDLNFSNPYQFSNFFKQYTKLSPKEYKQQFVKIGI